ncbi:MAG: molybdate ABC transporter substrate-binding protein [Thermomicrobiales bacterium]
MPGISKAFSPILDRIRPGLLLAAFLLVLPALVACGDDDSGDGGTLTVFAAASLTSSFNELGEAFEDANEGVTVEFNFAGSQALATQLAEGASADVFASANLTQMGRVVEADLVDGEPVIFAQNRLAILVPAGNPANVQSILDLGDPDLKLVLAAEDVPVGRYAREVLAIAEQSAEFQNRNPEFTDFNVVSNETNVLQVVTRVRLGEADAGIVYETDVTPDVVGEVTLNPDPPEFNIIADYPIAALSDGDTDLALSFIEFVRSSEGRQILADWGFLPVEPE